MTGKAGEEGHIRPKHGTDVKDRAEHDVQEPDTEPDMEKGEQAHATADPGLVSRSGSAGGAPVFVDPSGRRAGRLRRMGWLVAAGCVCSAVTLGLAVTGGNSTAPWIYIPGIVGSHGNSTTQNRSANEARQPVQKELDAPAAGPSSTAAGAPIRERPQATTAATTAAEAMTGPQLLEESGTSTSPGRPSAAGRSSDTSDTDPLPRGSTEPVPEQPSETTSPDAVQEPTTPPSSAGPSSPSPSTEPSPTGTPTTALLDGLVTTVSSLFGK